MAQNDDAKQDYLAGMKYREIAEKYGVSMNTVKSWRQRHGWKRGAPSKQKKGAPKKHRGAPPKNQYAVGNSGGHAPKGNKNALVTGEYEKLSFLTMSPRERELFEGITDDPLITINTQIRELKIRQYRIMQRIEQLKVKKAAEKESTIAGDVDGKHQTPVNFTLKSHRKFDDLLRLESALDSVGAQLLRAVQQKQRMTDSLAKERRELLNLDVAKAKDEELERKRNSNELGMQQAMHQMTDDELRELTKQKELSRNGDSNTN